MTTNDNSHVYPLTRIRLTSATTTRILRTFLILGIVITIVLSSFSSFLTSPVDGSTGQEDTDGDGLLNTWEINGIDVNNDGTIDFTLPQANPLHKNLYIEMDYMEFHRPIGGASVFGSAVEDVRRAFRNAPVANPDENTGINIFVLVNEQIPHANTTTLAGLATIKSTWFGTLAERTNPNATSILAAKRLAYHYGVFAHDQPGDNTGSSGVASLPGMDFLVTLGARGYALDPSTNHTVGTRSQQAATIMHEFGHNLNLQHGGDEGLNCKPNYLSVQNYLFQFSNYVSGRPLDYSRSTLPTLNESSLNEPDGIGQSNPEGLTTVYGPVPPGPGFRNAGEAFDWNFNGRFNDRGVSSNNNGGLACGTGPGQILRGFDDWSAPLVYRVGITAGLSPFQFEEPVVPEEQTIDDIRESRLILLEGINNAIGRLFESEPESLTETFDISATFDTSDIAVLLRTDQLDAAIEALIDLKAQVTDVFGEEAADREVVPQIINLIEALEDQKPSPPHPPSPSDCIGRGSRAGVIIGTEGPDTLVGTAGRNAIFGLAADDRINGCAGNDIAYGNSQNDGIAGGLGNDWLSGNRGDDFIQGDSGNDLLFGGSGINTLTGGPGRDIFVCSLNSDTVITDFVPRVDIKLGRCVILETSTPTALSTLGNNNNFAQDTTTTSTYGPAPTSPSIPLPLPLS